MIKGKAKVGRYKLNIIKPISKGAFGSVYLVEDLDHKERLYALKITFAQNQERFEIAEKELRFLKDNSEQQNDYFIQYIDGEVKNKNGVYMVYLLMEFGNKGTLFDLLLQKQREGKVFEEKEVIQLLGTIGKSLQKFHDLGYQHRDLKIENLLYYSDGVIKLCDFGSISKNEIDFDKLDTKSIETNMNEFEKSTNLMYRNPEMCDPYLRLKVDQQCDLWMLGCIGFTLLYFRHPFYNSSKIGIIHVSVFWSEQHQYSEKLTNIIRNLLTPDPNLRMNLSQFLEICSQYEILSEIPLNKKALEIKKEQSKEFSRENFTHKNYQEQIDQNPFLDFDRTDYKIEEIPQDIQDEFNHIDL